MQAPAAATSRYQASVAQYWNEEADPVNIRLGEVDGFYHHHYGIGAVDPGAEERGDEAVIAELHRLESAQSELLLSALGPLGPGDLVLDAGCGRGGTAMMAHLKYGCDVEGVTLSAKQAAFANERAAQLGIADSVRFHERNMLSNELPDGSCAAIWNNESTMYVDLNALFAEHARTLRHGGRYVTITGTWSDVYGDVPSQAVSEINARYICACHPRSDYFSALADNRLLPVEVRDLTADTIPYWELRARSSVATGVEEPFLKAYREGSFHYMLIVAERY